MLLCNHFYGTITCFGEESKKVNKEIIWNFFLKKGIIFHIQEWNPYGDFVMLCMIVLKLGNKSTKA